MKLPERSRATFYIVLIFLCGALAGIVGTTLWLRANAFADSNPKHSTRHTVKRFTQELNLTPAQAKQLNEILDDTHAAYHQLEAQEEEIRQKGRARIREMLTPEQKPKYEQILARIEARRKREQRAFRH